MPETSETQLRIARQQASNARRHLSDLLFDQVMDIREVLTLEQRGQINQLLRDTATSAQQ